MRKERGWILNNVTIYYLVVYIFFLFMIFRNERVAAHHKKISKKIEDKINISQAPDNTEAEKWRELEKIDRLIREYRKSDYNEMVLKFWKRPDDFYPEWFLRELELTGEDKGKI